MSVSSGSSARFSLVVGLPFRFPFFLLSVEARMRENAVMCLFLRLGPPGFCGSEMNGEVAAFLAGLIASI